MDRSLPPTSPPTRTTAHPAALGAAPLPGAAGAALAVFPGEAGELAAKLKAEPAAEAQSLIVFHVIGLDGLIARLGAPGGHALLGALDDVIRARLPQGSLLQRLSSRPRIIAAVPLERHVARVAALQITADCRALFQGHAGATVSVSFDVPLLRDDPQRPLIALLDAVLQPGPRGASS
jgi:hypothetical protein